MPCADCSLEDAISKEHFTGIDLALVVSIAWQIAKCLQHLHGQGVVHADLKPRNIVRVNGKWLLIDLDAACNMGEEIGLKVSSGYMPKELAELVFRPESTAEELQCKLSTIEEQLANAGTDSSEYVGLVNRVDKARRELALVQSLEEHEIDVSQRTIPHAHTSFDIWAFGVILYHLCTGDRLFAINDQDNVAKEPEIDKLRFWNGIDSRKLAKHIFAEAEQGSDRGREGPNG